VSSVRYSDELRASSSGTFSSPVRAEACCEKCHCCTKACDRESDHLDPDCEAVRDLGLVLTSWKVDGTFPPFSPPPPFLSLAIYIYIYTYIHTHTVESRLSYLMSDKLLRIV
jgi:hypothetical protein